MNIDCRYRELYTTDISSIKTFVDSLTEEQWNEWRLRQENFYVHSKTKSYPLGWAEKIDEKSIKVIIKNKFSEIWDILSSEITKIEKYYDGRCVNIMLANLLSGGEIPEHKDDEILNLVHRCHLPIITNDEVLFTIGGEFINLKEGIFYEINNQLSHSVKNDSLMDRVHLIVDILPNSSNIEVKFICE